MSKKTDTIELRVPPELTERFADHCRSRGQAMSVAIRTMVEAEISQTAFQKPRTGRHAMKHLLLLPPQFRTALAASVSILTVAALTGLVQQSPANAQATARAFFAEFDADGAGVITLEECKTASPQVGVEAPVGGEAGLPAICEEDFSRMEAAASDDPFGFAAFDQDQRGGVSFSEVQTMYRSQLTEVFVTLDTDKNDLLSFDEYREDESFHPMGAAEMSSECRDALQAEMSSPKTQAEQERFLRVDFAVPDANRDKSISREDILSQ